MFEIQGYAFIHITEEHIEKISFNKGLYVKDWTEAHKLMKENNVDHYLITLKEVK